MINQLKKWLKQVVPWPIFSAYFFMQSLLACLYYGFPSRQLVIVGITGTKGKTTAANFIWSVLQTSGLKTGLASTANIRIGREEQMNKYHMTMPGRWFLQRTLREMVRAGCTHAVVETTSEGIKQWRHLGIAYDLVVFTNLTPEHLPSHGGSFENYKQAKGRLFAGLARQPYKWWQGEKIPKTIIANHDSPHKDFFLNFPADQKLSYGLKPGANYIALNITNTPTSVSFQVNDIPYTLNIAGTFNIYNALPAIIVGDVLKIPTDKIQEGLTDLKLIPGRMEQINDGQPYTVIVDYAHEKESMTAVVETGIASLPPSGRLIILLGAEGGGRDKAKRAHMGEVVGIRAHYVVVSNVDPYEDDPTEILEDIAKVAETNGKERGKNLFVIADRRAGIRQALTLAEPGDIVIITGKGAEQSITIDGEVKPWDDRLVVREELKKLPHA